MTIGELVSGLKTIRTVGDTSVSVTDIQLDSRKVGKGCLFVAMRGTTVDGHQFIPKAIELGAGSVLRHQVWYDQLVSALRLYSCIRLKPVRTCNRMPGTCYITKLQ